MEISYRREIKHNYLIITPEAGNIPGYEARMLAGNEIQGLLDMHIRYQDGNPIYYYDITSRQPLNRLLETRFITRDEICQILIQIHVVLMRMEEYLLGDGGILLDPGLIYMEPELFQIGLCLVPGHDGGFPEQLSRFLQYILKCVNHKDRECVVLAYGMYQESLKDNYGMDDILKFIVPANDRKEPVAKKEPEAPCFEPQDMGSVSSEHRKEAGRVYDSPFHRMGKETLAADDIKKDCEKNISTEKKGIEKRGIGGGLASFMKQMVFWALIAALVPVSVWLFGGKEKLAAMRFLIMGFNAVFLLLIMAWNILQMCLKKFKGTGSAEQEEDPWRILYEDGEEDWGAFAEETSMAHSDARQTPEAGSHPEPFGDEVFQTALLCGQAPGEGVHRLRALEEGKESIILPYYPFVIGKNRNLADYVLQRDTVSRFHLKINQDGDKYTVTDLNSTNGTKVNGRSLDANETTDIQEGDEIFIADIGYIFE